MTPNPSSFLPGFLQSTQDPPWERAHIGSMDRHDVNNALKAVLQYLESTLERRTVPGKAIEWRVTPNHEG